MSKNLTLKQNGEVFYSADNPIVLNNYKYSAKRMGNAPTITATVNYPVCLDSLWTDEVYVEFRGERYFLKQIPSSSYDNTSTLYKHSLDLVSERIVLENVYFFDVVRDNTEDDKPVSNSSEFSFSGDVKQFAKRFEYSAKWSGLDYTVVVDDDVVLEDKHIQFQDQFLYDALQSMYETYKVPFYFVGKVIHIGYAQHLIEDTFKYGVDSALMSINRNNSGNAIVNRITGLGSDRNITYYYPNPTPKGTIKLISTSNTATYEVRDFIKFSSNMDLDKNVLYRHVIGTITDIQYSSDGSNFSRYTGGNISVSTPQEAWFNISFNLSTGGLTYIDAAFDVKGYSTQPITAFYDASELSGKDASYMCHLKDNGVYCGYLSPGSYTLSLKIIFKHVGANKYNVSMSPSIRDYLYWSYEGDKYVFDTEAASIQLVSGAPSVGDILRQEIVKRINVQNNLMPSIYRETDGEERFYNAENGKYKDEDGNDVVFANTYTNTRPREYIHKDEEIYPTIEGMLNAQGLRIDMFSEFAFDENDNDEIYPVGHEQEGKYVHPYFFGKLRKFNGEHGFNLFDHAIEGQPMAITMKSGKCASCEFTIGVDEGTNSFNPVQVTEVDKISISGVIPAGTLRRDDDGNVLCGRWPQAPQERQERQNDTVNYEVWIALKKEDETFGVIMPSQANNYLPEANDKFAILNINLPDAYVLAAEKRLEQSAIKYMDENNDYKFNYTAKLSRIYFEQNQSIASILNENSKVRLQYNGVDEELYVSSYSYNMSDNSPLPEVSIELNNDIKIIKGAFDRVKNEFQSTIAPTVGKIGIKLKEASSNLSNTARIAKVANETAFEAKTSSDKLKVEIKDVGAIASDAKLSAENAQLSATQAKDGITTVGNEVGSLRTQVKTVNTLASSAKTTADKAVEDINTVQKNTEAQFESVGKNINIIQKDVNALEGLIGDEYNIWFEDEGQKGHEPTLDNYPASDWVSDDDYFNHDKDLYYSITLGRAWRFMYNEGEPFWEEITDADTITALTRAQEALDKANEAINAVEDVKYLTDIFGEAQVENSHAATLGTLIAVTNENDNVTAGMYGGGIENLNNIGYKNFDHDAILMMFAGSKNVSDASNAPFRVYSDGCMYANHGTFGGILKRSIKEVDKHNLSEFSYAGSNGYSVLDLEKTGAFISIDFAAINNLNLRLPWYSSNETFQNSEQLEDVLSLLGTEIIIKYSNLVFNGGICFEIGIFQGYEDPETQKFIGTVSPSCLSVENSSGIIILKCMAGSDSRGISVGWEIKHL